MTATISRVLELDFGHRVRGDGACRHLHGHRWKIELHGRASMGEPFHVEHLHVDPKPLDRLAGVIARMWRGKMLISDDDVEAMCWFDQANGTDEEAGLWFSPFSPTPGDLARFLVDELAPDVCSGTGTECYFVVVWMTPDENASATRKRGG